MAALLRGASSVSFFDSRSNFFVLYNEKMTTKARYLSIALLISLVSAQTPSCTTSVDCPATSVVCGTDGACGPCTTAMDCITIFADRPICNGGVCEACGKNDDCSFMAPRSYACNATAGRCVVTNIIPFDTVLPGAIAIGVIYTFLAAAVVVVLFLTVCVPEVQELRSSYSGTSSTAMSTRRSQSVTSDQSSRT